MLEMCYGKEPFDLRLTVLRYWKNLCKILLLTLAGTLLFGGGYYVNKIVLAPESAYTVTSTYMVEYVVNPLQSGDYYINEMSWNTLVQSHEFLTTVQERVHEITAEEVGAEMKVSVEELSGAISAKLPSDWHIPTTTVVAEEPERALFIARAVETSMMEKLVELSKEVKKISVIDPAISVQQVEQDVRPVRAFVLSSVLSFFFVTILFLLKELGDDSIWLPATLQKRYGLATLGTINSPELLANLSYLFQGKKNLAVCSTDDSVDTLEVVTALSDKDKLELVSGRRVWTAVPAPLMCPETCEVLREMDGMLLVVPAGSRTGKRLEYSLAFLSQQDCEIVATLLWNADEGLIRCYYRLGSDKS